MALAMLVSLRDRMALEVSQNGSGRYPFTPHAVNKLLHVLRTCIHWGIQIVNVRKDTGSKPQFRRKGDMLVWEVCELGIGIIGIIEICEIE